MIDEIKRKKRLLPHLIEENKITENIFNVLDANNNPVSNYTLGSTYTVTLAMNSNPAKKGFQATALSGSNVMAGTFTTGTTTQIKTTTRVIDNKPDASIK
jgi:hypothetical protein